MPPAARRGAPAWLTNMPPGRTISFSAPAKILPAEVFPRLINSSACSLSLLILIACSGVVVSVTLGFDRNSGGKYIICCLFIS